MFHQEPLLNPETQFGQYYFQAAERCRRLSFGGVELAKGELLTVPPGAALQPRRTRTYAPPPSISLIDVRTPPTSPCAAPLLSDRTGEKNRHLPVDTGTGTGAGIYW